MIDDVAGVTVQPARDVDQRSARWTLWPITVAAVVAGLLRAPFLFTGLSTDEGGYAYVAQQWSRGARIYDTAWLDRPQGLLLTYRALLWINDSGWTIRLGSVVGGMIITAALGAIGWLLVNRRVGVAAAFTYAVVGVAPHLEGMTLNGELLASVPSTISIALAVFWWRRSRLLWWLVAAGLFAGLAVTTKQSGIDGIVVGLVVVALAARSRVPRAAAFLAGVAVPLGACVLHGISVGWSRYWTALAGYQFSAMGGPGSNADTRWSDFAAYAPRVAQDLALILVVSVFGWRFLDRGGRATIGAWLFAGFLGINLGGSYWPHYYVQPLPPLVLLVATAVVAVRSVRWRRVLAAVVVLPTLGWLLALIPMSPTRRAETIPYDALATRDDRIAAAIDASTTPSDRIYVLESEAYLYFAAQRVSPYPYLWGKPIDKIPDALPRLRAMLASPQRPTLVILDTPNPDSVDPSGGVAADLAKYYHLDSTVEGVQILRAG
jgi:4-amino-4-deoxy-L-arabinose transferase-like glycosyltransferase